MQGNQIGSIGMQGMPAPPGYPTGKCLRCFALIFIDWP